MDHSTLILIREFDPELFHKKIMDLETQGFVANRDTYKVTAEMNPEDGTIVHLHSIEMKKQEK